MELKGKKGDFDYAQSPKHLPENLRNPNGADRCLSGVEGSGYKQTEIGVIPEDWDYPALVDYGNLKNGFSFKSDFFANQGGNIVITPGNFKLEGGLDLDSEKNIYYTSSYSENEILKNGDLVLVMTDLTSDCNLLGKAGIINSKKVILHNQRIGKIIFNENVILKEYLYFFFNSDIFSRRMKANATGSTVRHTSKGTILNSKIPLPPLPEQQKIAEALGDTDALIQSLKKLIAKKKDIKQGAMQELLSGKRRLEGFKGEWVEKKLGDAGKTIGGLAGKVKNDFGNGNGKYITFLNVMNNVKIDTSILEKVLIKQGEKQNSFVYGDLFFNTSSETPEEVGMCAVLLENIDDLYLNSFCFGFRLHNDLVFDGLFLAYLINSSIGRKIFESLAQGATRYNLSKTNFNNIHLFVPHSIQEQTAIAQILSDMDAEIEALEKKLQKIEFLKQGMMQELLTGRIRLIKPQAEMPAMVAEPTQNYKTH